MRCSFALPAAVAAALALTTPATAGATQTFSGKTGQGRAASVTAAQDGRVTRVELSWRAECGGDAFVKQVTAIRPKAPARTKLTLRAAYGDRLKRGVRLRVTLTAKAKLTGDRWDGTLAAAVTVRRGGRTIDRCRLSRTTWTATRQSATGTPPTTPPAGGTPTPTAPEPTPAPGWHVVLVSEPGDPVGNGTRYDLSPSLEWALAPSYDWPTTVELSLYHPYAGSPAGWFFNFAGPNGEALQAGRRYEGARRMFAGIPEPGMDVSGPHTTCNQLTGWFEVRRLLRDPDGKLRSTLIDFEQWCEGGTAPLHGTVEYTKP